MFKITVTYETFEDNPQEYTEDFWFNLTERELIKYEVDYEEGLVAYFTRLIESQDRKNLLEEYEKLILMCYGERSADGKSFEKSEELSKKFMSTAAYNAIFMRLSTEDDLAKAFIVGVMPRKIQAAMAEQAELGVPSTFPRTVPPSTPTPPAPGSFDGPVYGGPPPAGLQ